MAKTVVTSNAHLEDIADHMSLDDRRSVSNKLAKLREEYGEGVVLTNDERKWRAEDSW